MAESVIIVTVGPFSDAQQEEALRVMLRVVEVLPENSVVPTAIRVEEWDSSD